MVTEVDKAMLVQSQEVRQDGGLLGLVGQLYSRGTWTLDTTGAESAANQGFALWAYRSLLPTIADRYQIDHCYNDYNNIGDCTGPTPARGIIGSNQNFKMAGPQYQQYQVPCTAIWGRASIWWTCVFNALSDDIMNRIWNPITARPDCIYQPGQSQTAWTFDCPAGDDVNLSVGQNTWQFNSNCGNFVPAPCSGAAVGGAAVAAQARRGAPIRLGRPRHGRRRAVRGRARLRAEVGIHPRLALAGATVRLDRLLFERRGRGELTRPRGGRAPRPLTLRRAGPGRFSAAAKSGRPRARIVVRRLGRRRASLTLTAGAAAFRAPRACHALPARVAHRHAAARARRRGSSSATAAAASPSCCTTPCAAGATRAATSAASSTSATAATGCGAGWRSRCADRGACGREPRPGTSRASTTAAAAATGCSRLSGTSRSAPAAARRGPAALRAGRSRRIRELRAGRSRRLIFTIRVPRAARGRLCAQAVAGAPGARAARGRVCSRIQAAGGPASVTG